MYCRAYTSCWSSIPFLSRTLSLSFSDEPFHEHRGTKNTFIRISHRRLRHFRTRSECDYSYVRKCFNEIDIPLLFSLFSGGRCKMAEIGSIDVLLRCQHARLVEQRTATDESLQKTKEKKSFVKQMVLNAKNDVWPSAASSASSVLDDVPGCPTDAPAHRSHF